jgi:hypothetical protein
VWSWVTVAVFPELSVPVTENVWGPTVAVSIGLPEATSPVHEAIPEPPASSAQE